MIGAFFSWFLHYTGTSDTSGKWYGFWSGFGSDLGELTLITAVIAAARHKNCYKRGCWRLGHIDPKHGHPACKKHHTQFVSYLRSENAPDSNSSVEEPGSSA
jgi:hypothetical protein